jgi:hypothetical protein
MRFSIATEESAYARLDLDDEIDIGRPDLLRIDVRVQPVGGVIYAAFFACALITPCM